MENRIPSPTALLSVAERVPNELLREFLSFIPNKFPDLSRMESARLVCRRWNAIATSTPQLWTNIVLTDDGDGDYPPRVKLWTPEVLEVWLSRSSNLPLNVVLTFQTYSRNEEVWECCKAFCKTIPRWESLDFAGHPIAFEDIFEGAQPCQLKRLSYYSQLDPYRYQNENSYSYLSGYPMEFESLTTIALVASPQAHLVRFLGNNVTTLDIWQMDMDVEDYIALSQDTPNVGTLIFADVSWHRAGGITGGLLPNAFGHRRLKKFHWSSPDCHMLGTDATTIFNRILSGASGLRVLEVTWNYNIFQSRLSQSDSAQPELLDTLLAMQVHPIGPERLAVFAAWVAKFPKLQVLDMSVERYCPDTYKHILFQLFKPPPANSPVLEIPREIILRCACVHMDPRRKHFTSCNGTMVKKGVHRQELRLDEAYLVREGIYDPGHSKRYIV